MPVGPHILCPENARKSQPNSRTSSAKCPMLCAASTSVSAPTARACSQSSATGLIVPSEFEICVKANNFTSGVSSAGNCSSSRVPSSRTGTKRSRAPVRSANNCHGTRLLWCSITVSRITSPSRINLSPHACATRLMLSVVPRVKMISSALAAPIYSATRRRAFSYASVARELSVCNPRCTLAFSCS